VIAFACGFLSGAGVVLALLLWLAEWTPPAERD